MECRFGCFAVCSYIISAFPSLQTHHYCHYCANIELIITHCFQQISINIVILSITQNKHAPLFMAINKICYHLSENFQLAYFSWNSEHNKDRSGSNCGMHDEKKFISSNYFDILFKKFNHVIHTNNNETDQAILLKKLSTNIFKRLFSLDTYSFYLNQILFTISSEISDLILRQGRTLNSNSSTGQTYWLHHESAISELTFAQIVRNCAPLMLATLSS